MQEYTQLLKHIINNGKWKDNRTGVNCLTTAGYMFQFDMSEGDYPLVTTRKMPYKSMLVELEGFIKGITDKSWYQDRGCKFWDHWANPYVVNDTLSEIQNFLGEFYIPEKMPAEDVKKLIQKEEEDLGPIYGYQWRSFNKTYSSSQSDDDGDWGSYSDQLTTIVEGLKTNPNNRRLLCSAWNPNQISHMALPPCHYSWGVVHIDGTLNLYWTQRSCDAVLGIPNNIASYATLLLLLCKESGLKPGTLTGFLADLHIYENHLDGVKELVERKSLKSPKCIVSNKENFDIFEWEASDFTLIDYESQPKMTFSVAV